MASYSDSISITSSFIMQVLYNCEHKYLSSVLMKEG